MSPSSDAFAAWLASLEAKHLGELTFREVSRSLRVLSATYVERRRTLVEGAALSGRGKRAAFALFYGPLHHLLVAHIVRELPTALDRVATLVDLGCGNGAAGAAWAAAVTPPPRIVGLDIHPWAVREAAETYRMFGLAAKTEQRDITAVAFPKGRAAILAAFAREGWRAERVYNGPPNAGFGLVRCWIENHTTIEIGGREMRDEYERFFREATAGKRQQIG